MNVLAIGCHPDDVEICCAGMARTCSKCRGCQCGAAYAEGFRMCKAYLNGTTRRLLP